MEIRVGFVYNYKKASRIGGKASQSRRNKEREVSTERKDRDHQSSGLMWNDLLALSNSDQPGAQLFSVKLDGTNFLNWNRNVKLASGAKIRLGFIDGSCRRPSPGTSECARWIRADQWCVAGC